jgi:3-dehydroquinate dehydratase
MINNDKRKLKPYCINLYEDIMDELKSKGIESGPYIRQLLDLNIDTLEKKQEKAKKLKEELETLNSMIEIETDRRMKEISRFETLSEVKLNEIKEAIKIIERDKNYFEGRRMRYNNMFKETFTKVEFQKLLENHK